MLEQGAGREPDRAGADRPLAGRLGRDRARGRARHGRQRRDRLLHREHRPDGRPHRRLGDRRAGDDPHRPRAAAPARRRDRGDPRRRRLDRRRQRAVRARPRERRDGRDRDEPARVALVGPRVQGDRLPDRQDRRPPGRRLHARRAAQRDHGRHPGQLRADARLRRGEDPALRVREGPGRVSRADDPHEERGGGAGARAHVRRGLRQGHVRPRARCAPAHPPDAAEALEILRTPSWDRYDVVLWALADGVGEEAVREATGIDPWFLPQLGALAGARGGRRGLARGPRRGRRCGRARRAGVVDRDIAAATGATELEVGRAPPRARRAADLPRGRHLRRRVRRADAVLLRGLRGRRASWPATIAPSIVVLGSGPNRIGQGIEFDYCCVHAAETAARRSATRR